MRIIETKYVDDQDSSSISVESIELGTGDGPELYVRFTAENSEATVMVDLTPADALLFLVDLRDVAGIVDAKRETRTCGCPTNEPTVCGAQWKNDGRPCVLDHGHQGGHLDNYGMNW